MQLYTLLDEVSSSRLALDVYNITAASEHYKVSESSCCPLCVQYWRPGEIMLLRAVGAVAERSWTDM